MFAACYLTRSATKFYLHTIFLYYNKHNQFIIKIIYKKLSVNLTLSLEMIIFLSNFRIKFTDLAKIKTNPGKNLNPHVSVDCVIFGFDEKKLKVLLIEREKIPTFPFARAQTEIARKFDF